MLHNLILHLEGGNFDTDYHEHLLQAGKGYMAPFHINDDSDGHSDQELLGPETPGQLFHEQVMACLFNNPSTSGKLEIT